MILKYFARWVEWWYWQEWEMDRMRKRVGFCVFWCKVWMRLQSQVAQSILCIKNQIGGGGVGGGLPCPPLTNKNILIVPKKSDPRTKSNPS